LENAGDAKALPLSKKSLSNGLCLLRFDDFQGDGIAAGIDEVTAIETSAARKVAWPDEVQLLQHSWSGNDELGVRWPVTHMELFTP